MPAIDDSAEGFLRTVDAVKLLLGQLETTEQPLLWYSQFGHHGYAVTIYRAHLDFLQDLNDCLAPNLPAFDGECIERWRLINELLMNGLGRNQTPSIVTRNATMLACLVAFPTLEEIARKISSRWDEDGRLLNPVTAEDGVTNWSVDSGSEVKIYKAGNRIVLLAHKLQLMHGALDPRLAKIIDSLDCAFRKPMIEGQTEAMSPLYVRLQFFRDHWLHGRRIEGWEGVLVSMLLSLIYFGSKHAQDNEKKA
jgi:hypothetical protein